MSRGRKTPKIDKPADAPTKRLPVFSAQFLDDLQFWVKTEPATADRLFWLVRETLKDPFRGAGKPEPMKGHTGWWSRRLTEKDRIAYWMEGPYVHFLQARFHYKA